MVKKVEEPRTRKVRVNEQRSYVDEEPIEEVEVIEEAETEPNPIQTFLQSIDNSRSLTMKVFLLPNFYKDGKRSIRANERPFVTQFPFSNEDITDYQQRIQQACPAGGMFQIELREGWQMVRIWEEPIAPAPGYQASGTAQEQRTYPIIVNPAMNPAPVSQPAVNPADMMREQMGLAKDLVAMAKDLAPPAPIVNVGEQQNNGDKSVGERIIESLTLKALESDKVPVDRLLEAIGGGRKDPSIWEGVLEVAKIFAPTIDRIAQQFLANQQRAAMSVSGPQSAPGAQPLQALSSGVEGAPEGSNAQDGVQQIDPISRDWFQVIIRMLEDCTRHVELASVGGGSKSVLPSAEAVIELAERYPERLGPTIQQLLAASPAQVLDLCSMMLDERGRAHIEQVLKPAPASVEWIRLLQEECKRIIEDARQDAETETDAAPSRDMA